MVGNDAISGWITDEDHWLSTQPVLVATREYRDAIFQALLALAYPDLHPDLGATALKIIAAARTIPGVNLP